MNRVIFLFLFCDIVFICLAKPRDAEDAVLRGRPLDLKTEVTKIWQFHRFSSSYKNCCRLIQLEKGKTSDVLNQTRSVHS